MKKVYFSNGVEYSYMGFCRDLGYKATDNINEANLVIFTGGNDINPNIYGDDATHLCGSINHARDIKDMLCYKHALELNLPMLGICRGSQFLCAMNGGKLYQHVENHALFDLHPIITKDGEQYNVSSTHHQMMRPEISENPFELIAWAGGLSEVHFTPEGNIEEVEKEPEIVYWPKSKSLCIQSHPESMDIGRDLDYIHSVVTTYIGE